MVFFGVLVDADDDVLLLAVALLVAPGGFVDLAGDELDGVDRAAELVDFGDEFDIGDVRLTFVMSFDDVKTISVCSLSPSGRGLG